MYHPVDTGTHMASKHCDTADDGSHEQADTAIAAAAAGDAPGHADHDTTSVTAATAATAVAIDNDRK